MQSRRVSLGLVLSLCALVLIPGHRGLDARQKQGDDAQAAVAAGQVIEGTKYINRTAHFTLTLPADWRVTDALMKTTPNVVGTVAAPHHAGAIMMQRYDYPFSPETAVRILEHGFANGFVGYHRISETPMVVDGKSGVSFAFEFQGMAGPSGTPVHLPGKLLVVAVANGDALLDFTCQAPLSQFDEMQSTFKKIVTSYHYSPTL